MNVPMQGGWSLYTCSVIECETKNKRRLTTYAAIYDNQSNNEEAQEQGGQEDEGGQLEASYEWRVW